MYQVCICPEDEVLNINCKTLERAKQVTKDYYPSACFLDITEKQFAIYEKFELEHEQMNHVGNIWLMK